MLIRVMYVQLTMIIVLELAQKNGAKILLIREIGFFLIVDISMIAFKVASLF